MSSTVYPSWRRHTYAYPVDIEYTINCASTGEYVISLLQCRPLQLTRTGDKVSIPAD